MKKRSTNLLRSLDYFLGILLVVLLGLFKKKKKIPKNIKAIGILKTVALGDLTLVSAVIQDIKLKYPKADIFLFLGKDNSILAPYVKGIKDVIVLDVKKPLKAIFRIRKVKLDVLLDFGAWPRIDAILSYFSKANHLIGFKTKGQYRHFVYHLAIEHKNNIHEIDNYRNLAKPLDVNPKNLPKILLPALEEKFYPKKYCCFHLSGSGLNYKYKNWPIEHWKVILDFLENKNIHVFLTGSKSDYFLNQRLIEISKNKNVTNFANQDLSNQDLLNPDLLNQDLSKTLQLLKNSEFLITVNTGIMHIAAALNINVISINGPTNPKRWGALGKKSINILPKIKGCGFTNLGFEYKNQVKDCIKYLYPKDVIEKITPLIGKEGSSTQPLKK